MTPLSRTICVLVLGGGFAGSALAAMDSAGSTSGQNVAPAHISQRLRDDLSKAGFTDITIMPTSFLVRAKDSEGNPVMMVVNPDSLTEVTDHAEPPVSGALKGDVLGSAPRPMAPQPPAPPAPPPPAKP